MRTVWMASVVFFVGALASIWQDRLDATLLCAGIGFELAYIAESSFDWNRRITRRDWRQAVFEERVPTTIVGKLCQSLCFLCLIGFFIVRFR